MNAPKKKHLPALQEEWLIHAYSDLNLARLGRESRDVLPQQICFHAQQVVEKAFKAVLLLYKIDFPYRRIHRYFRPSRYFIAMCIIL